MSDKPAAFSATFSDFKLIKTRQCVQLVFEVPLDKSTEALACLGGMPNPAAEVWCAIARMESPEKADRPRQNWSSLKPSQQAGIVSADETFWDFLAEEFGYTSWDADGAAEFIRKHCMVSSRADIAPDNQKWLELVANYRAWKREAEMTA